MTVCNAAPSVVCHAQREQCIQHNERCDRDRTSINPTRSNNGYCTVIENGKVVVKPIEVSDRSCGSN